MKQEVQGLKGKLGIFWSIFNFNVVRVYYVFCWGNNKFFSTNNALLDRTEYSFHAVRKKLALKFETVVSKDSYESSLLSEWSRYIYSQNENLLFCEIR